jgi:hypothetical protein
MFNKMLNKILQLILGWFIKPANAAGGGITYKFYRIWRDDNGLITKAEVIFYDCGIATKNEFNPATGAFEDITKMRLGAAKTKEELTFVSDKFSKAFNLDSHIYDSNDFGTIKTDEELREFLDGELKKDKNSTPLLLAVTNKELL